MRHTDKNMSPEGGYLGFAPVQKTGVEQTGATGANPLGSSCSAPLPSRGADNWSSGAKAAPVRLEQKPTTQGMTAPIGTEILLDGQPYRLTRIKPHTRVDGSQSKLLVWRAPCWECGAPFDVTTPITGFSKTPSRRCPRHRRPGIKVRGRATFDKENTDMQSKPAQTPEWSPRGKFGIKLNDDDRLSLLFRVVGNAGTDRYAVVIYSWLTGDPTETRIWHVDDLINCPLFDDEAAWWAAATEAG